MNAITLIFPNQLFENHPSLEKSRVVWLVEDFLFFKQLQFHAQKRIFHRASMKEYQLELEKHGFTVVYIETCDLISRKSLGIMLRAKKVTDVYMADVIDTWLQKDINACGLKIHTSESPMFITTQKEIVDFFGKQKKPFMKKFYEWQRNRLMILMEDDQTPTGGVYSFDTENRKKLPKGYTAPSPHASQTDTSCVHEAMKYAQKYFPDAYGAHGIFMYETTRKGARNALRHFVEHQLHDFGVYEDALSSKDGTINHSVLTPYLNVGLLTPQEVVAAVLDAYAKNKAPLNSVEGYIRQIIGWREFMRAMYALHGKEMRTKNFWNHTKKLDRCWWQGETGIVPIDTVISRALDTAYSHHIERLMVIGGYMVLDEIDPNDAYRWFMEMYIDAYDWVMVPNVYGMSQFADGGIFATKPYISSSNYILKMSDYKKGEWCEVWDKKFWNFLEKHRDFFSKNPRMKMLLAVRDKNKKA